jgi:hypothetical protein
VVVSIPFFVEHSYFVVILQIPRLKMKQKMNKDNGLKNERATSPNFSLQSKIFLKQKKLRVVAPNSLHQKKTIFH